MSNTNRELIYYSPDFTGKKENFSGTYSPVGTQKRKEYLAKYAADLKEYYRLNALPEKVVSDEETDELLKKYRLCERGKNISEFAIKEADAFVRDCPSPYKGWHLYTFGAEIKEKTVCFSDGVTPPVPAAKYEFNGSERLAEFTFSFSVEKFFHKQTAGIVNVRGKFFELRSGIRSVLKLHLLADGQLYYFDGSKDGTHPAQIFLSKTRAKEWNEVTLRLKENACDVVVNGVVCKTDLPLYSAFAPDTFFVSGGMHPMGKWAVRLHEMKTATATYTEFFTPAEECDKTELPLGKVSLPFAIGTQKYADKELVFRTRFHYNGRTRAILTLNAIDPCGLVYVNGQLVCKADDFLRKKVPIDDYVKEKWNKLEIVVKPRAPEVFYQWHRHTDPYNGWFFRGGVIEFFDVNYVEDVHVVTQEIRGNTVAFDFYANLTGNGIAKLYLRKVYPYEEIERDIAAFAYFGRVPLCERVVCCADAWDCDSPNVYEIIVRLEPCGSPVQIFEKRVETGFRIIEQKNGEIYLNGKRILLNGALSMQFLPPHAEVPVNHLCASDAQIVTQLEQIKRMNGNTLRMHFLGYGSNDERYARYADRVGCMLVWTTRLIDGVESVLMDEKWKMAEAYASQIKEVRQYPSIIMWEGSNEAKGSLQQIDALYDQFVAAVRSVDTSRLICPCSHLYYGGGIYDESEEHAYYQDDGRADQHFRAANSSWGWTDKSVVRSAHTYAILLGYGQDWDAFARQAWASQAALLESKEHAYAVTEYAVIGRACPYTAEAKEYYNPNSYELDDEKAALGFALTDEEYELSQAHQALCALYTNKKMRTLDIDGMMWCCLQSGANDASYLKPIIDFYGYAKFAFYVLKDYYRNDYCVLDCDGPFWNENSKIKPVLLSEEGNYRVRVSVADENGNTVFEHTYEATATKWQTPLEPQPLPALKEGYYTVTTATERLD